MGNLSNEVNRIVVLPPAPDGSLPMVGCVAPGDEGEVFLTDELNHRVLSFDAVGKLSWSTGSLGTGAGQFHYPRGLCPGWIERADARESCIAVADSWNRRVSFLDRNGKPVESWGPREDRAFGEIIDLRYVPPEGGDSKGTWLLLDRTRHRLLGLAESGELVFKAGRELPPFVTAGWQLASLSILRSLREPGVLPRLPPRDYLYYPCLLLGQHPQSLMIWEPLSRALKVSLWGNFLPILPALSAKLEWVTASSSMLLGWDPKTGACYCYDGDGEMHGPSFVEGRPVPCTTGPPECWVQSGTELRQYRLWLGAAASDRRLRVGPGLLARSAAQRSIDHKVSAAEETVAALLRLAEKLRGSAEQQAAALRTRAPLADAARRNLPVDVLRQELAGSKTKLLNDMRPLLAAAIDWRFCCAATRELQATPPELPFSPDHLVDPLRAVFRELVGVHDNLRTALVWSQSIADTGNDDAKEALGATRATFAQVLAIVEWIYTELGPGAAVAPVSGVPRNWKDGFPGRQAAPHGPGIVRSSPQPLVETRRIMLQSSRSVQPPQPTQLCVGPNGLLAVSLSNGNEVQLVDLTGKVALRIGESGRGIGQLLQPTAVLYDNQARLWVSDTGNRRVQVWFPPYDAASAQSAASSPDTPLQLPAGLIQLSTGEVLVADPLRNLILAIGADFTPGVWLHRAGSGPGEVSFPIGFATEPSASVELFWLVDRGNHRVQRLDSARRCLSIIGACGLEDDSLFDPRSAACLSDGSLVVVEARNPAYLVFLNSKGTVTARMPVEYQPGTPIECGQDILIPDLHGTSIRVYARV